MNHIVTLDPAAPVLKADQVRVLLERSRMLRVAREEADRIVASTQEAYQAECRRGYEEGLAQAKLEQAERMIEIVTGTVDYLSRVEGEMVELVTASVQKIVNGFDENERVLIVVRNAIAVMRNQKHITLRVNPAHVECVKSQMRALLEDFPFVGHLDVVPDSRLALDACILESEMGVVEASVSGQIQALRNAFEKVMGSRPMDTLAHSPLQDNRLMSAHGGWEKVKHASA